MRCWVNRCGSTRLRRPLSREPRAARRSPPGRGAGGPKALMQVMTTCCRTPPSSRREQRRRRDRRAKGRVVRVRSATGGRAFPRLRGRIFGRFAQADSADSRVKGGPAGLRHLQAAGGNDAGRIASGTGRRRHHVLFELPVMQSEETAAEAAPECFSRARHRRAEYLSMVLEKGAIASTPRPTQAPRAPCSNDGSTPCGWLARRLRDAEDPLA